MGYLFKEGKTKGQGDIRDGKTGSLKEFLGVDSPRFRHPG